MRHTSQSAYFAICGLAVTLTFDLLTCKSNQFIFVSNCTSIVHLVKFPQLVCKISCSQRSSIYDHGHMDTRTARRQHAFCTWLIDGEVKNNGSVLFCLYSMRIALRVSRMPSRKVQIHTVRRRCAALYMGVATTERPGRAHPPPSPSMVHIFAVQPSELWHLLWQSLSVCPSVRLSHS